MKIIITHDIDHLTVREHFSDLIIPKFMIRSHIELIGGFISLKEINERFSNFFNNKWQNLAEIFDFDKENEIPSTFFIGMDKGLGLSYPQSSAQFWANQILSHGFDLGVHGIAFSHEENMKKEYEDFKRLTGLENFGIRMHYLRKDETTLKLIGKAGYLFDTGIFTFEAPYKTERIWEFPIHIMDTYEFQVGKPWQNQTLDQVKKRTEEKIQTAINKNLPYLNVLMHDFYFSEGFSAFKQWYIWLVERLKNDNFEFINFKTAIRELESNTSK